MQCSGVEHSVVPFSRVEYSTVRHSTIQHNTRHGDLVPTRPGLHVFFKSAAIAPPMDISGSRIGVNASKVLLLHSTHALTKFGLDMSYRGTNDTDGRTDGQTDRRTDRVLYASPWVWQ